MSDPKKYSLKPIEIQLIRTTQQQLQTVLSNIMSMIAIERFAYDVTENTRFTFNEDMTEITIVEVEENPEAEIITDTTKKEK